MKKIYYFFTMLLVVFSYQSNAQGIINAGQDTAICLPGSVTLNATLSTLTPTILSSPGNALNDDGFAPTVVNIGFNFIYFGNTYSQCAISTNNYISFDLANVGGYSPYQIGAPIPGGPATTYNAIMGPWQDLLPASGGTIRYATIGTAPNRIFVVEYCSVAMFSCTSLSFSSQIQLHENGSVIETHIIDKPICTTWNTGQAIHGIQNSTGTIAFVNAGRNAGVQWSASNEGTRFAIDPVDPNNYFITSIPFSPVTLGASGNISWSVVGGGVIGNGSAVTVSPTTATSYVASIADLCSGFNFYDTVQVTAAPVPDLSFFYPSATFCADTITVLPTLGPGSIGDFSATPAGLVFASSTTGAINLGASAPGTYTIVRTGSNGGCVDSLSVQINITSAPDPTQTYPTATYCAGGLSLLPSFTPTSSAGLFSATPAGLVFTNTNTGEVDLTASAAGVYTVTNTITGFGCPTTTDTSTVTIAIQTVDAGAAAFTCTGTGILLNGIATGPNSGNVTWTGGSGAFTNPTNDTTFYNPSLNDAGVGFINLVLTINGTPTCPSIFDIIAVTVELGAVCEAGANVNFCGAVNPDPINLNGTINGQATSGSWSTNGSGSFADASALITIYTPTAGDLATGSVTLILTTDDPTGNCPAAVDSFTVTYSTPAAVTVGSQQTVVCAGQPINLNATVSGSYTSIQWTSTNGTGVFATPTALSTTYTPNAADGILGNITFIATLNAPPPCSNVFNTVSVNISAAPSADIIGGGTIQSGQTVCPSGNSVPITINLDGNAPWTFTYAINGISNTISGITDSTYTFNDSIPGTFTITSLIDGGSCPGIITGLAIVDSINIEGTTSFITEVCGDTNGVASISFLTGGNGPYTYLWNNAGAATSNSISNLLSGSYNVLVTDANNCTETFTVNVPQILNVDAAFGADSLIGPVPLTINFTNNSSGASTYLWDFGNGTSSTDLNPTNVFDSVGVFSVLLTAYNTPGCIDTARIVILAQENFTITETNIFSPNGDGKNDKFTFEAKGIKAFKATIFNRWGLKVASWEDPLGGWDGGNYPAGVYFYIVEVVSVDGQIKEPLKGTVTLMR